MNYLSPGVKRGDFTAEEEDLIIRLHKLLGNRSFFSIWLHSLLLAKHHFSWESGAELMVHTSPSSSKLQCS